MKRFLPLLLLIAGCYQPVIGDGPKPAPSADPIVDSAEQAIHDYARGLSESMRQAAEAAPSFKDHDVAIEAAMDSNKVAREKAFKPHTDAMDAALKPQDDKYDAALEADVFKRAAAGFERVSK